MSNANGHVKSTPEGKIAVKIMSTPAIRAVILVNLLKTIETSSTVPVS
ncbi:MAG TPA: hypothetical protein PLC97_04500 [Myxococcota bacterium]|jgi:hypothetical protein|nr:hypothetical protein [Myxococcota bacterium]